MTITIRIDKAHYEATGELKVSHEIEDAKTLQDYINIGSAFELSKGMIIKLLTEHGKNEMLVANKLRGKKKDEYLRKTLLNIQ